LRGSTGTVMLLIFNLSLSVNSLNTPAIRVDCPTMKRGWAWRQRLRVISLLTCLTTDMVPHMDVHDNSNTNRRLRVGDWHWRFATMNVARRCFTSIIITSDHRV
jgi:hypothetical protein